MSNLQIITTSDGSHSLLNTDLNETYHSVHGALRESIYVFIKHGLDFFIERSSSTSVRILEIGFGTGLNALLTLQRARETNASVHYTSLEAFPIQRDIWRALNYAEPLALLDDFNKLHEAEWMKEVLLTNNFTLLKLHTTLQQEPLQPSGYDVIYFDAFAPSKQPEMWELPMLTKVVEAMKPGGVFVTYCAKGQLKRDLKSLNLTVETLPGPPGKKEMIRAVKE